MGTRLRPLTLKRPKALVEVNGKPLLEHLIGKMKDGGVERIVVNVHHFASQVTDFLQEHDNFGMDIRVSDESARLLDTGGGLKHALPLFEEGEGVLVYNVDVASQVPIGELADYTRQAPMSDADVLLYTNVRRSMRYLLFNQEDELRGRLKLNEDGTRTYSRGCDSADMLVPKAFTGMHYLRPAALHRLADYGEDKFPIMEFYTENCTELKIKSCPLPDHYRWVDCGRVESLVMAEDILR